MGKSSHQKNEDIGETIVRCTDCGHKIGYASKHSGYVGLCIRCIRKQEEDWLEDL